ncbi:MAG: ABC transporter substrate-binding protein, partial [Desulfatiglandales bacterium]|nr:ABC transporter substrate-binding protein [Desulfatiglandales bacterium]
GLYKIKSFEPGRMITYERVADYWGKDLPVNKGSYNFDLIRYDYYRDATVALQAFKAGEYDFRLENLSKNWATAYNIPTNFQAASVNASPSLGPWY